MKISEWMQRDMATVVAKTSVTDVARIMCDRHVTCVPVVDSEGRLAGVVTEQDLIVKHAHLHFPTYIGLLGFTLPLNRSEYDREIEKALATTAGEVMTEDVKTLSPDEDIDEAATLMVDDDADCIPIVEADGGLVGLVTRADIVRLLVVEEASA